jgi:diguanylate cyclase (GGDEF)-like protein
VRALIPGDDHVLKLRLRRQLMAAVSYLMFIIPLSYSISHGWMDFGYRGLLWFAIVAAVLNVVFFALIRSGWTARFVDPSLAMVQIACACALALLMSYFAGQARVVTLMLFFTASYFGIFSFTTRQYLQLTIGTAAGYAVMLAVKYRDRGYGSEAFSIELLHFVVLVVVLLWMSLLGGYVTGLRGSLARKNAALGQVRDRLLELASHDELTGVFNRRHLIEILEQQKLRADRHGEAFCVSIIDLDLFKRLNDAHGHQAGDEVLQVFAKRMRASARRTDAIGREDAHPVFGRYGGEEFMLVLPYTALVGATQCLSRMRAAMAEPMDTCAGALPITFSAGIAAYRAGESAASLLARADAALYRAKDNGRDRVETES